MGWLWASPSPTAPAQPRSLPKPAPAQNAAPSEPVDPEIQKFFDLFKTDAQNASSSEPVSNPAPRQQDHSSPSPAASTSSLSAVSSWLSLKASPKTASPPLPAPPRDALAESLLPTEMSCRQAFDIAWACNSIGGQFNSVYRYGKMRSCSEHWDDFWFCMRTKSYTGELKENMIRQHYRDKEHAKYGPSKPSSEDIWETRTHKLPPGTAFSETIDQPQVGDDEWRRREAQRRAEIRQGLGYNDAT